jgi:hypothetical protein
MAIHYDDTLGRYVSDCESLPEHHDVPTHHAHRFFLRRDLTTAAPKQAVIWAVWTGGFKEIHTWPCNANGLAQAQAWCDEHGAAWQHSHAPVHPGSLATHANAN